MTQFNRLQYLLSVQYDCCICSQEIKSTKLKKNGLTTNDLKSRKYIIFKKLIFLFLTIFNNREIIKCMPLCKSYQQVHKINREKMF